MQETVKTAIVLGSGGHTGEMLKLLSGMNLKVYKNREYIVADTDSMSIQKVQLFESFSNNEINIDYNINKIYRSRHVGQSYITSIITTLIAIFNAIPIVFKIKPEILLVNGPGTSLPICLILFFLSKCMFILPKAKIIFVESLCRVKTLSLTGKILYYLKITDLFFVQWPELNQKYPKSIFIGRLV